MRNENHLKQAKRAEVTSELFSGINELVKLDKSIEGFSVFIPRNTNPNPNKIARLNLKTII
ncbi:hypothetical protein [Winogradskyella poriferorum]|uniref:hypothetical protein n=1 Tax=Winogradskyella poriferorum TaxID=307627 RepID=UPI003D6598AD